MDLVTTWDLDAARRLRARVEARGRIHTLPFVDKLILVAERAIEERAAALLLEAPDPESVTEPELTPRQQMALGDIDFELRRLAVDGPLSSRESREAKEIMERWAEEDRRNSVSHDWKPYLAALARERNKGNVKGGGARNGDRVAASRRGAATVRRKRRAERVAVS